MQIFQESETLFGLPIEITTEGKTTIQEVTISAIQIIVDEIQNVSSTEKQERHALHLARKTAEPHKFEVAVTGLKPMNLNFSIGKNYCRIK